MGLGEAVWYAKSPRVAQLFHGQQTVARNISANTAFVEFARIGTVKLQKIIGRPIRPTLPQTTVLLMNSAKSKGQSASRSARAGKFKKS